MIAVAFVRFLSLAYSSRVVFGPDPRYFSRVRFYFAAIFGMLIQFVTATRIEAQRSERSVQDFRISDTSDTLQLSAIIDMANGPRGLIAAGDYSSRSILVFDERGRLISRFGKSGRAPGEFQHLASIGFHGDSVWGADPVSQRVTLFALKDGGVRTYSPTLNPNPRLVRMRPIGLLANGSVFAVTTPPPGLLADRATHYLSVSSSGSTADTLLSSITPAFWRLPGTREQLAGQAQLSQPFLPATRFRVSSNGAFIVSAVARGESRGKSSLVDVHLRSTTGQHVFRRTLTIQAGRVPPSSIDSVLVVARMIRPIKVAELRKTLIVPEIMPPLARVYVSSSGSVVLQLQPGGPTIRYVALNARGDSVGTFTLPRSFEARLAVEGALWGVERDEDDVPTIVRYRYR